MIVLGDAPPIAADAGDADAEADALPSAEEPTRLEQAWARPCDKGAISAGGIAADTGPAGQFDEQSTAGTLSSALAEAATSRDTLPTREPPSPLDRVLATGPISDMLAMLPQPPAAPPVAEPPSGWGKLTAELMQLMQLCKTACEASHIASVARARSARVRLQNLRQAATAIAAVRRATLARRAAASRRRTKRLQQEAAQHARI